MKRYWLLIIGASLIVLSFLGGMYAYSKIADRFSDDKLSALADSYESEFAELHKQYREQIELLETANRYLENSIDERERQSIKDQERIAELTATISRLQKSTGTAIGGISEAQKTVRRIETAANDIGKNVQSIRGEVQKVQKSE